MAVSGCIMRIDAKEHSYIESTLTRFDSTAPDVLSYWRMEHIPFLFPHILSRIPTDTARLPFFFSEGRLFSLSSSCACTCALGDINPE